MENEKNAKIREFMRLAEKRLRLKIEHHNLNLKNIHIGAKNGESINDPFDDIDLNADVVDERIEKQIAARLNQKLEKVKKGSLKYQEQEQADQKRVKETFAHI